MAIKFKGWWDKESEINHSSEPWETFTLICWGEKDDHRDATEEDLKLAGYVPIEEVKKRDAEILELKIKFKALAISLENSGIAKFHKL